MKHLTCFVFLVAAMSPHNVFADAPILHGGIVSGAGSSSGGGIGLVGRVLSSSSAVVTGVGVQLDPGPILILAIVPNPDPDPNAPQPILRLELHGNTLQLSWPATALGYLLEESPAPRGAAWSVVLAPAQSVGDHRQVSLSTPLSNRYYRLRRAP